MKSKRTILLLVCFMFSMAALPVSALRYAPPYASVDGGRAAQNMPVPFSVESAPKLLLASADFDREGYSDTLSPVPSGAVLEGGAVVITKSDAEKEQAKSVTLRYSGGDFEPGETVAFVCKIKTAGVAGGAPRNLLAAYGSKGWLDETHGYDGQKNVRGDSDWYTMSQMLEIPKGTTYLNLTAYVGAGITGTVYFDDFALYRLAMDPLESVLCAPNYKGLLYGDGHGDIDLDVLVYEQRGFYNPDNMQLAVCLVDSENNVLRSASAESVQPKMNFVFSSAGLAEGDYYLQTVLTDAASGTVLSQKEHTIRKRNAAYRPEVYLDAEGHMIQNGEKTFLKRIYNYNGNYREAAEKAADAGITSISNYGLWWASDTPDTAALAYMRSQNIKSHICLSSYWFSDRSGNMGTSLIQEQTDILPLLTQIANDYKNDTVLDGYYLFDEPNPVYKGEEIRWNNEIMAQADINHPTYGVADKCFDRYGAYVKMADVVGVDPYPIYGLDSDDVAAVGRSVKAIKQSFPNRPIYVVLQGFHQATAGQSQAVRSPNFQELRNMAWQAICEGAEGLDCYAYPDMKTDPSKDFDTWWSEVKSVYHEVSSYQNVLLSDEAAPLYYAEGGERLNLMVKRYNGMTYLFAVNPTKQPQSAAVTIEGLGRYPLALQGLEVRILAMEQNAYPSPAAELKSLGFYNGNVSFPVAEGEETVLYVPMGQHVINYTADISDGAQLYIGGVARGNHGNITLWHTDSFTVRVTAADGVTSTEKHYRVVRY